MEALKTVLGDTEEGLGGSLLGRLIGQVPGSILEHKIVALSRLGQDSNLKVAHAEQQLRVLSRVDRYETLVPLDRGQRPRERVLDIPEHSSTQVDVMLDQSHSAIPRPASLVVVSNNVLVVGIRLHRQVPLDQVTGFVRGESEEDVNPVYVSRVEPDGVSDFGLGVSVLQEPVGELRRSGHFTSTLETQDQEIQN